MSLEVTKQLFFNNGTGTVILMCKYTLESWCSSFLGISQYELVSSAIKDTLKVLPGLLGAVMFTISQ